MVECLPAEEDDVEDIEMPGDELRDGSEGEEQEDGEQRDGSVAEHAGHSKRDLERAKKALMKLHVNLGHPGVKELIRVLKHGRASELTIQEARRMRCDVCAENVQPKLPRPVVPRQVLDFNERLGLGILKFILLGRFHKIFEMSEHCVSRYFVSDDHTSLVGNDRTGSGGSLPRRLAALGT